MEQSSDWGFFAALERRGATTDFFKSERGFVSAGNFGKVFLLMTAGDCRSRANRGYHFKTKDQHKEVQS